MQKYLLAVGLFFVNLIFLSAQNYNVHQQIEEVYGPKNSSFFQANPDLWIFFEKLLNERIEIKQEPISFNEKYTKLSEVPLNNKYNPALTKDGSFNVESFNPLKYQMNFYAKTTIVYRVDNTEYLIVIKPQ
jgi:hypothetical protein